MKELFLVFAMLSAGPDVGSTHQKSFKVPKVKQPEAKVFFHKGDNIDENGNVRHSKKCPKNER